MSTMTVPDQPDPDLGLPALDPERVYEAIAAGVEAAMWRMITSATGMPCHDSYATMRKVAVP
jgi:hypothetical protein